MGVQDLSLMKWLVRNEAIAKHNNVNGDRCEEAH